MQKSNSEKKKSSSTFNESVFRYYVCIWKRNSSTVQYCMITGIYLSMTPMLALWQAIPLLLSQFTIASSMEFVRNYCYASRFSVRNHPHLSYFTTFWDGELTIPKLNMKNIFKWKKTSNILCPRWFFVSFLGWLSHPFKWWIVTSN